MFEAIKYDITGQHTGLALGKEAFPSKFSFWVYQQGCGRPRSGNQTPKGTHDSLSND
jgi:hypothetical protein